MEVIPSTGETLVTPAPGSTEGVGNSLGVGVEERALMGTLTVGVDLSRRTPCFFWATAVNVIFCCVTVVWKITFFTTEFKGRTKNAVTRMTTAAVKAYAVISLNGLFCESGVFM